MKRFFCTIVSIVALSLISGCFDPFHHNPYFEVEDSGLNWLEIYNKQASSKKLRRIRIDGSGVVKIKSGTSPLVGDSFAKDNLHEKWEDVRNDQITIPKEEAMRIYQGLVNNGLFLEQKKDDDSPEDDIIMVFGNVQNHTVYATIYEPDLHEHLKSLVLLFDRPKQKRKR